MDRLARLCSTNEGKLRELRAALPEWRIELLDADGYPPETGATYLENARGKAAYGRSVAAGVWMIGEDSGLEVDGLGGRPGIHSARFGSYDPVEHLLEALRGIGGAGRRAGYVCELVALSPEGDELRGRGELRGRIVHEPRGSEGFGYDPIFVRACEERSVAELGDEWKRRHSHRARAAAALASAVRKDERAV